jgi:hypothetical protein
MEEYHQQKSREEQISLLVDYTNWLLGEGYVDSDVYAEEPTAIDGFMEALRIASGKEEG